MKKEIKFQSFYAKENGRETLFFLSIIETLL